MAREVKRVMHPLRLRQVEVLRVSQPTPRTVRVTVGGPELEGFVSLAPDDHVKLFFPYPGETDPVLPPVPLDPSTLMQAAKPPIMRDYTPLKFDSSRNELELEFFLHEEGIASDWAATARAGRKLGLAGPRGSMIVPYEYAGYVMIGDETAWPSFERRLLELPSGAPTRVLLEVGDSREERNPETAAALRMRWIHRREDLAADPTRFIDVMASWPRPLGDVFVWLAGEKSCVQTLKAYLLDELKVPADNIKATAYWARA